MSNNNPPFYVGQEVVCVDDGPLPGRILNMKVKKLLKKGKIYVVDGIEMPRIAWNVKLPTVTLHEVQGYSFCCSRFRPIQRHPNAEVAEELKNIEVVEERIDVPQTVTA